MNNPKNYPWETTYVSAALETDFSKLIGRIGRARQAIKHRLATPTQIDDPEHRAIEDARRALATLEAERFEGSV